MKVFKHIILHLKMRKITSGSDWLPLQIQDGLSHERKKQAFIQELDEFIGNAYMTELNLPQAENTVIYKFDRYFVHVNKNIHDFFKEKFKFYIEDDTIYYDNLINLCIMVKNAGDGFREILERNLPYIDRYTILDTGSTDNTVSIIKDVMKNKRGELYQEPFINFRDSRNRLLELAGTHCFFNVMLDDTYVLHGRVREFLNFVRGDDIADSFSITIESTDTMYLSNRITKAARSLRYVNKIHEIIEPNMNVSIPYEWGYIEDVNSPYMQERTMQRKLDDVNALMEMLKENPLEPRTYYYIADSYLGLKEWKKALEWFEKRANLEGYKEEIQDSYYYIAVLKHMYLNYSWEECFESYLKCYEIDPTRPESLYFIATYYLKKNMYNTARLFLKQAYYLGFPSIQMSGRKNIYNFHIPKDLAPLCYETREYKLGEEAARKAISYKDDTITKNWFVIYRLINQTTFGKTKKRYSAQKLLTVVSPGGWSKWDGETLYTKGLGGSESIIVRYSEYLCNMGYRVLVFCDCERVKDYKNVTYIPLSEYSEFISNYIVDISLVNRYVEYTHLNTVHGIKTYLLLHDTPRVLDIIPTSSDLLGILCVSEWHKDRFLKYYPVFKDRIDILSHGINTHEYKVVNPKERYMFIYPNFPNRGLLQLLKLWPFILNKYPSAKLNLFCDTKNSWCQEYWKDDMSEIDRYIEDYKDTVTNHGWVNGEILRQYWTRAHVWFYPCTFEETFCLTALEAAASKTLVVTNHLAGLKESVGDRGLIIEGDASTPEWHDNALKKLFEVIDSNKENEYVSRNYNWVMTRNFDHVVSNFAKKFLSTNNHM
jgi:glycosyltransferase involved in cell wall biosynthesis